MERERVQILVEVDLDPIPGAFHTPDSALWQVEDILRGSIPHYNPMTTKVTKL